MRPPLPAYCCGGYQLARPDWISAAACSGVNDPLITWALTFHSWFSRLGSPRERIWYELRIVDSHSPRQLRNSFATGSSMLIEWFDSEKNPGRALE